MMTIGFLASAVLSSAGLPPKNGTPDIITPEKVIELGPGWAGNTVNTVIFRHHGVVTRDIFQFAAYYESDTRLVLVRRDLSGKSVDRHVIEGRYNTRDAHNCISLGIDPRGFLHLSYDHHGNELRYRRSLEPLSIGGWTDPIPMTGVEEDRVTYPYFLMAPVDAEDREGRGMLLFLYRTGGASNGDLCLKTYDPGTSSWSDTAVRFVKGTEQVPWTSSPYWNHPPFDTRGRLHLSWVWRVNRGGPPNAIHNYNMAYACSPDRGKTWLTTRGLPLVLPMTPVNAEIVWPVPPGAKLANQCSSAVDSKDRPHIAYYAADTDGIPQVHHLWFDGRAWRCDAVTARTEDFDILSGGALRISRPEIVIDREDRVYLVYLGDLTGNRPAVQRLDPPAYAPPGTLRVLLDEDLRYAEPVIDRFRWARDGILSMLIQGNARWDNDRPEDVPPEPVRLVDWKLDW